jgi:hypothetical protein
MFNSTVSAHYALANMDIKAALSNADPEFHEYRYTVFPNLKAFVREVFVTCTDDKARMSILSPLKDEAINMILSARMKAKAQAEVKVNPIKVVRNVEAELNAMTDLANEALDYADKYLAEIAELKAANRLVKSELEASKALNGLLSTKLTRLEAAISKVRSVNLNGVITKVAVFTGIKQSV